MFNLSRAGYYADFLLAPAAAIWLLVESAGAVFAGLAFLGLIAWTLIEYLVHRFVFHWLPRLSAEHDRHHRDPAAYIGASSFLTMGLFGSLWLAGRWQFGLSIDPVLIGLVLGYFIYIAVHDRLHHAPPRPGDFLYASHHRHSLHHRGLNSNFGVSTPVWDHVFRTYRR